MSIAYQDDFVTLHTGTALDVLREMPAKSVHMSVCSPPYWGLRSYLPQDHPAKGQEIGTERTPDEFVAKLVEVFAEVHRVLRDDATLWVNIGDSYVSSPPGNITKGVSAKSSLHGVNGASGRYRETLEAGTKTKRDTTGSGLKPKDLCMIPARLAIALCDWGWYLRQELVWAKDSCMPESVRDRCTRSHEFVYMLTKRPTYFYDAEAIKEPVSTAFHEMRKATDTPIRRTPERLGNRDGGGIDGLGAPNGQRNARSVWKINPKPYPGSHFATFPPELPQRCIKAGTSERGVCSAEGCGAPWRRVVEKSGETTSDRARENGHAGHAQAYGASKQNLDFKGSHWKLPQRTSETVGWQPTCAHEPDTIPATVLDPFAGSGTTLYAARSLGRKSVGIDIDEKSTELLQARLGHQGVLL